MPIVQADGAKFLVDPQQYGDARQAQPSAEKRSILLFPKAILVRLSAATWRKG